MRKILSLILAVFILSVILLPVSVLADEPEWVQSADGQTLSFGGKVYEKYAMPPDKLYFPEGDIYLYEVESIKEEYDHDYVSVVPGNDDIVRLHFSEEVFVTEEGRTVLDKFIAGEFEFYLFFPDNSSTVTDFIEADFSRFIKEENKTEIDVTTLWNGNFYEVRGFDKTGTFSHSCGAVYEINTEFYYIHYDSLDNSYFDAYGAFSYRGGKAPAYKLDEAAVKFYKDAQYSSKARLQSYIYPEEEMFLDEDDDFSATVTFWMLSLLFGFILPAVPLVLSIVFANSKMVVHPKRWYFLTGASALWIISALGIILTLTI